MALDFMRRPTRDQDDRVPSGQKDPWKEERYS